MKKNILVRLNMIKVFQRHLALLLLTVLFFLFPYNIRANGQTCPANIVCFDTPLYTSTLGTWYLLWKWEDVGVPSGIGWTAMARQKPVLGFYKANDQVVYEKHRQLLKNAGIDFVMSDATNSISAVDVSTNMLSFVNFMDSKPVEDRVKIALVIGSCTWAEGPSLQTVQQRLDCQKNEADWVWNNLAQKPSYFRVGAKPLLVNYTTADAANTDKPETWNSDPYLNWDDNRFFVGYASGLVSAFPGLNRKIERGTWGWTPDLIPANPVEIHIAPGWDRSKWNDGVTDTIRRQNGETLMDQFLQAIEVNPTYITVGNFNDFAEEEWWEPATVDMTLPLVSNWKPYYSEPSAEALKAKDAYGTEIADWYYQIVRAYSLLRWGFAEGSCYKDIDNIDVYCVNNKILVYQGSMPRGKPIIKLPAGTINDFLQLHAPTPTQTLKPCDLNGDTHVDIFDYNILVSNFNKTGPDLIGDIVKNNKVDIFDYNVLVANFGK